MPQYFSSYGYSCLFY